MITLAKLEKNDAENVQNIFLKIVDNNLSLMKCINLHIQEAQGTLGKLNAKRYMSQHILIKILKQKYKNLKSKKKKNAMCKRHQIRLKSYFSLETIEARK